MYCYDGGTSFQELDGSGNMQVAFVRGSGKGGGIGSILYADRSAYSGSGPVEHYTFNAVGHTVALTDATGSVSSTNLYEAFGNIVASSGSSDNDKLANTKERDFSLDLDNHGFRYYDPATGRYITRDPAGEPDGPNNFLYVGNNPINHIDPQGLSEDDFTEDDLEPARAIQETLQANKSETSWVGDFQEGAQVKSDPEPYPVKTCMNCHGDMELLSGKKPVSELNRSQRATMLSWRSGNTSDFAGYVSEGAANTDLDNIQLALDAMGMTPGLGIIADGLNTGISLARGHYGEAMFNAAAMVPLVGQLSNVGRYGVKYADEAVDAGQAATRSVGASSKAARRGAMRQQQIPTSQQPWSQSTSQAGREFIYEVPAPGGGTKYKAVQEQFLDRNHPGARHWEAGDIKTDRYGNFRYNQHGRVKLKHNKSKVWVDE